MQTLFIHTNRKQLFGAKLGKYSFEREAGPNRQFEVQFIIAEEQPELKEFVGKTYLAGEGVRTYGFDNLQSFTLARLKAPELMGYAGRAIVIDPDIFALSGTNLEELFAIDLEGKPIGACRREGGKWESSVMVLECAKLRHWKLSDLLAKLEEKKVTHAELMSLTSESDIKQIPWVWNSMDRITPDSKMLHTTKRLTQPWKTGLRIDFTQKPLPKLWGFIPRKPIHMLLGKYPTHYLPHPDVEVQAFFFRLAKDALRDGVITEADIRAEIQDGNIRKDFLQVLATY